MRTKIIVLATLVLSTEALAQSTVVAFPHDPYRWCAVYSGDAGGASITADSSPSNNAGQT